MNWYFLSKMSADEQGNPDPDELRNMIPKLREDAEGARMKKPLGDLIKQHYGAWPYPFYQIKPANGEGWAINWFDNPGGIHDINQVNVGDKITDDSLNHTPYWEVTGIDEDKGMIYVMPLENNMWVTGVGAGGAQIDDFDRSVASGEYEENSTDHYLGRIQKKQYADPQDVAYILKGTIPKHVGANGSQGGWYACQDHHARGYQENLNTAEIIQSDAKSLKRLGFDVPPKGLDGTLSPLLWNDYVNGQYNHLRPERMGDLRINGEDINDPQKLAYFILHHPEPQVKKRNFVRLQDLISGEATARELRNQLYAGSSEKPEYQGKAGQEKLYAADEAIHEARREGKYARKDLLPMLRNVIAQMPQLEHKHSPHLGYDAYAGLKEKGMYAARNEGWDDLLQKFEGSKDKTTRHFLIACLGHDDKATHVPNLLRMEQTETDPENLQDILYALEKAKVDIKQIVAKNPQKYQKAIQAAGQNSVEGYYSKELKNFMIRRQLIPGAPKAAVKPWGE